MVNKSCDFYMMQASHDLDATHFVSASSFILRHGHQANIFIAVLVVVSLAKVALILSHLLGRYTMSAEPSHIMLINIATRTALLVFSAAGFITFINADSGYGEMLRYDDAGYS